MVKCVEILLLLLSASILSVSAGVRYYEYGGLSFNEQSFRRRVDAALEKTKQFLRAAKEPVRYLSAGDVPHLYDDKFYLADFIAGSAVQSMLNLFRYFGATNENLTDMIEWAKEGDTISLHFAATQHCAFDHWEVQRTESPTQSVVTEVILTILSRLIISLLRIISIRLMARLKGQLVASQ